MKAESKKTAMARCGIRWFTLTLMLLTGCTNAGEPESMTTTNNEPSVLMNKPYVTARIEAENCAYTVEINGAFIQEGIHPVTVEIPVNHWLRSGENTIRLYLYTAEKNEPIASNAQCSVTLRVRDVEASSSTTQTISRLAYSGEEALVGAGTESSTVPGKYDSKRGFNVNHVGDVEVGKVRREPMSHLSGGGVVLTQKIAMPLPFPEWAFFRSDDLPPDVDKMSDEEFAQYFKSLHTQYKRIYDALKRKDVDSILPLFEERNREMDIAMFYSAGTFRQKIETAFKDAVKDPELELVGIGGTQGQHDRALSTFTDSNKKMVQLGRDERGDAIVFNIRNAQASEQYPIIFRRQNGQWIITR